MYVLFSTHVRVSRSPIKKQPRAYRGKENIRIEKFSLKAQNIFSVSDGIEKKCSLCTRDDCLLLFLETIPVFSKNKNRLNCHPLTPTGRRFNFFRICQSNLSVLISIRKKKNVIFYFSCEPVTQFTGHRRSHPEKRIIIEHTSETSRVTNTHEQLYLLLLSL